MFKNLLKKKDGRDDVQEVYKKDSRKANFRNFHIHYQRIYRFHESLKGGDLYTNHLV